MKPFVRLFKSISRNSYFKFSRSNYKYASSYEIIKSSDFSNNQKNKSYFNIPINLAFAGIAGFLLYIKSQKRNENIQCLEKQKDTNIKAGERKEGLPDYTLDEVAEHTSEETGIWVVYKDGVYDITSFFKNHPGGTEKISMAIGTSVEPFWNMYRVHLNSHVFELLETLRIGNVKEGEEKIEFEVIDFYKNEPKRDQRLKINSAKPFNAEAPVNMLTNQFYTPNELFFVRNHLPVPNIKDLKREIEFGGEGFPRNVVLTIDDMKEHYKKHEISSTVMCAGNRRSEMNDSKPVKGLMWGKGAASNAKWSGVRLCDVLKDHGINGKGMSNYHVVFQGSDTDMEGTGYEASIPLEVALDENKEVLLAFEMNGKELPLDHGYPVRVVVPGVIGARQVKWLKRIEISKNESNSFWQRKDYKMFNPSKSIETADTTKAIAIQEYPVQSAICVPKDGDIIKKGELLEVEGYALSGGGKKIVRVDISVDGGIEWIEAEMIKPIEEGVNKSWAWTLWKIELPIDDIVAKRGFIEICCKATDSSHNTQPESDSGIWNTRGLLENKWSRIKLNIEN